jgi:hypothetical protein
VTSSICVNGSDCLTRTASTYVRMRWSESVSSKIQGSTRRGLVQVEVQECIRSAKHEDKTRKTKRDSLLRNDCEIPVHCNGTFATAMQMPEIVNVVQ